jgi:hypothetical protein
MLSDDNHRVSLATVLSFDAYPSLLGGFQEYITSKDDAWRLERASGRALPVWTFAQAVELAVGEYPLFSFNRFVC